MISKILLAFLMILSFGRVGSEQLYIAPEPFIYIAVGEVMVPIPSYYGLREVSTRGDFFYVSMVSYLAKAKLKDCRECGGGFVTFTNDPDASRVGAEYSIENELVGDKFSYRRYKYSDPETGSDWDAKVAIFESDGNVIFVIENEKVQDAILSEFLYMEEGRGLLSGNGSSELGPN